MVRSSVSFQFCPTIQIFSLTGSPPPPPPPPPPEGSLSPSETLTLFLHIFSTESSPLEVSTSLPLKISIYASSSTEPTSSTSTATDAATDDATGEENECERGQSAAVEPPEKSSRKIELLVTAAIAYLCFYGVVALRYLNALSPRGFNGFSDAFHLCGLSILVLDVVHDDKTCPGLSLKSLLLTELHLAVKVSYGFLVEYDVRFFDIFAFLGTLSIIVGFKGKSSYLDNQDNFKILYLMIPCALLSLVIHPVTSDNIWIGITIAFCCYLNSISMLPQLELMRKREIVDRLTSQYICLLGFQRLSYLGNLIIEILLSQGQSVTFLGYYRYLGFYDMRWAFMGVLLELVNGFILADYCYYYMTTDFDVRIEDLRLPSGVV